MTETEYVVTEHYLIDEFETDRNDWKNFYKDIFGFNVDFLDTKIPFKSKRDCLKIALIPKDITCDMVYDAWFFPKNKIIKGSFDNYILSNVRHSRQSYAFWVEDSEDVEIKFLDNKSGQDDTIAKLNMTLLEHMIIELKYFYENKKHLNHFAGSFCRGTRYRDKSIPYICFARCDSVESNFLCIGQANAGYYANRTVIF